MTTFRVGLSLIHLWFLLGSPVFADEIAWFSDFYTPSSKDLDNYNNPLPPAAFYLGWKDGGGSSTGSALIGDAETQLHFYDPAINLTKKLAANKPTLFETTLQVYLNELSENAPSNTTTMTEMNSASTGIRVMVGMDNSCQEVAALAITTETPILTYDCVGDLGEGQGVNDYTVQFARNPSARFRALVGYLKHMNWTTVGVMGATDATSNSGNYNSLLNTLKDNDITVSAQTLIVQDQNQYVNSGTERFISGFLDLYLKSRIIICDLNPGWNIHFALMALTRMKILESGEYFLILTSDWSTLVQFGGNFRVWSDMSATYSIPKFQIVNALRSVAILSDLDTANNFTFPRMNELIEKLTTIVKTSLPKSAPCPPLCDYAVQGSSFAIDNGTNIQDFDITTINAYHAGKALAIALQKNAPGITGQQLASMIRNTTFDGLMNFPGVFDDAGALRRVYYLWTTQAQIPLLGTAPIESFCEIHGTITPEGKDDWVVELDPVDEWNLPIAAWPIPVPKCGFSNELCPQAIATFTDTELILMIVSAVAALVMIIIIGVIIRWIMYERRLESCYWLINRDQVILLEHSFAQSIGKSQLKSGMSFQSTGGLEDLEQRGAANGTLQFYERNLREERRQIKQVKKRKTAFTTEEDDRWQEVIDWKLGKFDGQLVTVRRIEKPTLKLTREMKQELDNMMHVNCENLNKIYGLINEQSHIFTVHAFGPRMSLNDLVRNTTLRLDRMFKVSFVEDIMRGLSYLHNKSKIGFHGNLKSTNCVVDAYWRIRLSNFSMLHLREGEPTPKTDDLLWTAPEILRRGLNKVEMTANELERADIYSFAFVLYEIFGRQGPWGDDMLESSEIIEQLKYPRDNEVTRPDLSVLGKAPTQIIEAIKICWSEDPHERPSIKKVRGKLKALSKGMRSNIADNIMALLDRYRFNLEDVIKERTEELTDEKRRNEQLLLQMLPRTVADNLKEGKSVDAEYFDAVSIYFSDIVGFTSLSSKSTPLQIVDMLNDLYTQFDTIIDTFDCYKVETIGDAYMFVSGLPLLNGNVHAGEVAGAALELLARIQVFKVKHYPDEKLRLRIGIHTGPVVTGVVGVRMPRYCLFGDTVITASAMESSGEPMKIQVSEPTYKLLHAMGGYEMVERGKVELKNKVNMRSYWLSDYDVKVRFERLAMESNPHPHLKKFVAK